MAKGRIYGFGEMAGLDLLMLNLASGTEDVSRANWIAKLAIGISIGIATFIRCECWWTHTSKRPHRRTGGNVLRLCTDCRLMGC